MAFLAGTPVEERVWSDVLRGHAVRRRRQRGDLVGRRGVGRAKAASPVVVIGAGLSGILAGIRLTQAGLPFTIIEKNAGPGGTWCENRYPGARVDVGSHQYCYSFEPSYHWSEYYCQQPELRDYFERSSTSTSWVRTAASTPRSRRSRGTRRPRSGRSAAGARRVCRGARRAVRDQRGRLAQPPQAARHRGHGYFTGPSFHSARWPDDLDLTGHRFALIGAGASGFQIAPTIAETSTTSRSTSAPRSGCSQPGVHACRSAGDHWALRHLPFYARWFRFLMTYPGIATGTSPYSDRSGLPRRRRAWPSTRPTRRGGSC